MDIAIIYQKVVEFLVTLWQCEFVFGGVTVSIGAVVLWSLLAGVVIGIVRGFVD